MQQPVAAALDVHATTVARDGWGALLRGPSGTGKSDLALRFIGGLMAFPVTAPGMHALVADDRTILRRDGDHLIASCPAPIRGRIEVRGIGIVACPAIAMARLAVVVDLVPSNAIERLPDPTTEMLLGLPLCRIALAPFEPSAPQKLALAIDRARLGWTA